VLAKQQSNGTPLSSIIAYSTGDGAYSLTMNGIWAFSMLFYTQALGLDYKLAGIALSISVLWDAITDPLMGHISDNTRSRFGKRHPYILMGGILLAISFYFLWAIPQAFKQANMLFWYLLVINIVIRTALTIYYVPYLALGFEICKDYHGRSKIQSVRWIANMIANFLGPALAWSLFFKDTGDTEATNIASNYVNMGTAFAIATFCIIMVVTFTTRKYISDSRQISAPIKKPKSFFVDTKEIISDKYSLLIYAFYAVATQGMILFSTFQMYLYVYFMKFPAQQKTIAHGMTMVGFAIGSFLSPLIEKRLDKKPTVIIGSLVSIVGNLTLAIVFLPGFASTSTFPIFNIQISLSMIIFVIFNSMYWAGCGILTPIIFSMVADTSEINKYKTGVLKDGSYSAMFSFLLKAATSLGLFIAGYCLDWIGFVSGTESQTPAAIFNLAISAFASGIIFAFLAMLIISKYPVNREFMSNIKAALAEKNKNTTTIIG
jgi:glycoside/pentoside/hexuronide:cation symporter, GPH family